MRILALETDREKLKRRFLSADEREMITVRYHPLLFFFRLTGHVFITAVYAAVGLGMWYVGLPGGTVALVLFLLWIITSGRSILQAYIDWQYDFLLVTNDKVVIVNQTTVVKQEVRQLHLENFATVSAHTQFLNLFPFGKVCFDLKEGTGTQLCLPYIPDAENVAAMLSDVIESFQRPKSGPLAPQPPAAS
jgi:hypothetical protein